MVLKPTNHDWSSFTELIIDQNDRYDGFNDLYNDFIMVLLGNHSIMAIITRPPSWPSEVSRELQKGPRWAMFWRCHGCQGPQKKRRTKQVDIFGTWFKWCLVSFFGGFYASWYWEWIIIIHEVPWTGHLYSTTSLLQHRCVFWTLLKWKVTNYDYGSFHIFCRFAIVVSFWIC